MLARFRIFAALVLCVGAVTLAHSQQSLNNKSVMDLQKAGLSEDLIVTTINSSPGKYDTSTDSMIAMKKAGVTDKEIGAMLSKNANPNGPAQTMMAAPAGPMLPPGVDEIGVYYKDKTGKWVEFSPEIVTYKTGGFLKTMATNGIVKMDKNGHVKGKNATLILTRPVEILMYAPEGTAPNEYLLLKLRQNSSNREFRSETGGVIHQSTGAERDEQEFTAQKIGTRLYTFSLGSDAKAGEYGILPPGAISSTNAASAGKIDTFQLAE